MRSNRWVAVALAAVGVAAAVAIGFALPRPPAVRSLPAAGVDVDPARELQPVGGPYSAPNTGAAGPLSPAGELPPPSAPPAVTQYPPAKARPVGQGSGIRLPQQWADYPPKDAEGKRRLAEHYNRLLPCGHRVSRSLRGAGTDVDECAQGHRFDPQGQPLGRRY